MSNPNFKKIIFVSIPRSGHHLLSGMIHEIYNNITDTKDNYCEYYSCCKTFPCAHGKLFCKNHDFDITVPINPDYLYIVQYRLHPYDQLQAFYNLDTKYFKNTRTIEQFIETHKNYYRRWKTKWIRDNHNLKVFSGKSKNWINNSKNPTFYYVDYEGLVEKPHKYLTDLCNIIFSNKIDPKMIDDIITKNNICYKNHWNFISKEKFKKILNDEDLQEKKTKLLH